MSAILTFHVAFACPRAALIARHPEPVYVLESVQAKWWFTVGVVCGMAVTVLVVGLYARRHAHSSRWDERSITVAWSEAGEMLSTARGGEHAGFVLDYGL